MERILKDKESYYRAISNSILISADNAHGVHPNYADRYDANHDSFLNMGPVIKHNANQRYATESQTSGFFHWLAKKANVPVQQYVNRTDMRCGSTIGPISATNIGIPTIDIGLATFAMHSIRETCGIKDIEFLYRVLCEFFCSSIKIN